MAGCALSTALTCFCSSYENSTFLSCLIYDPKAAQSLDWGVARSAREGDVKAIQQQLEAMQSKLRSHGFFAALKAERPPERILDFAPRLTFWVMAFQDILRLNEKLVTDPKLVRIARHHRREDANHEKWFLTDVGRVGGVPDLVELFGPRHATIRDATYALAAETFRAPSDRIRVVLLLTLEAAGHVFFEEIADLVENHGQSHLFKYFSDFHLKVEQNHQVFEQKVEEELFSQVLSAEEREAGLALVGRASACFAAMFDVLAEEVAACASPARAAEG